MTPQERQLIDDLFDRLSKVESAPRDPNAVAAIAQGLRIAPNAVYALVQTVLLQDEALKRANSRIQQLEAASASAPEQNQSGGFLDSMRDKIFGQNEAHGSVPNVRPPETTNRPVWNSGQVLQQSQGPGQQYNPAQQANQGQYGQQPYGAPQAPMGGGGSFLGTAAAAAAGTVGGSLLLGSIRSMMGGGNRQAFGESGGLFGDRAESRSPWSDQSNTGLARDAGVNDVGSQQDLAAQDRAQDLEQDREDDNSRTGSFDQASNDDNDDHDDMDDSDNFGGDNDGDYV
jgi:uncharacterized protein